MTRSYETAGNVMALVNDDVAIARDEILHLVAPDETLEHGVVESSSRLVPSGADPADLGGRDTEEYGELGDPLLEQWTAVDEHQRVSTATGDQGDAYDGLSGSRRSHQNPSVVGEQVSGRLPLRPCQRSLKRGLKTLAVLPLVFDDKLNSGTRRISPVASRRPTKPLIGAGRCVAPLLPRLRVHPELRIDIVSPPEELAE
jgi:hypothetical protein